MYFIIKNKYNWNKDYLIAKVIRSAIRRINIYKVGARELALDEYLIKKLHKPLKLVCKDLVLAANFYKSGENYIVKFINTDIENLANFITFGDGVIQGSNILKAALAWN